MGRAASLLICVWLFTMDSQKVWLLLGSYKKGKIQSGDAEYSPMAVPDTPNPTSGSVPTHALCGEWRSALRSGYYQGKSTYTWERHRKARPYNKMQIFTWIINNVKFIWDSSGKNVKMAFKLKTKTVVKHKGYMKILRSPTL